MPPNRVDKVIAAENAFNDAREDFDAAVDGSDATDAQLKALHKRWSREPMRARFDHIVTLRAVLTPEQRKMRPPQGIRAPRAADLADTGGAAAKVQMPLLQRLRARAHDRASGTPGSCAAAGDVRPGRGRPAGTPDEFLALYRAHVDAVRSMLYRMGVKDELDDVTQAAFLNVWQARASFEGRSQARTWIIRIALNAASEHHRKARSLPSGALDDAIADARTSDPALTLLIERALGKLTTELRAVIVLHVLEGYGTSDVARMLTIPEGTVKSRLSTARARLSALLSEKGVTHA